MGEELFRKSALDKLASPERLDELMEVTPGKGWVALATIGALAVGFFIWSIFGSIPERIDGQGMLVRGGGLRQLRAGSDGTLTGLTIKINDLVKDGQIIGQISQLGSTEEIKTAKQAFDQAQRDYEISRGEDERTIVGIRGTISGLEADKRSTQTLLQKARETLVRQRQALKDGLVTRSVVDQAERDVASFEASLTGKDGQISNQNAQIRSVQERIRAKEEAVARARRELERVSVVSSSLAKVSSTVEGHVVELRHRVGDFVRNGEVIATIEPPSTNIEPVVYISSTNGKRVKPGMEVQVSPSTVRREEYGFMKGLVRTVGEYAVTAEGVEAVTGNKQLVEELLKSGTKIEVQIGLLANKNTPSGYGWSSSDGPPFKIEGGTRVSVSVVASQSSPFNYYVTPIFRNMLGL
jgi:HlyD family secretion protein